MKWISSYSPMGRRRTPETIMTFALCNAVVEGLPFTSLNPFGNITHNFKG